MATKKNPLFGKTFKFIGAKSGLAPSNLGIPIGTEVIIKSNYNNGNGYTAYNVTDKMGRNLGYAYEHELELVKMTLEDIEKIIKEKEIEITELKTKAKFIKKFGLEEYDEDEFKAYAVLETIGIDDIQKARAIVKILNK